MPGSNRYFQKDGIVTAGNASGINDGAGFLLDTTAGKARVLGLPIAGQLISFAIVGVDPAYMGTGPIPSIRQALKKADLTVDDIAVFEINEAFAPIALAAHPSDASGARGRTAPSPRKPPDLSGR